MGRYVWNPYTEAELMQLKVWMDEIAYLGPTAPMDAPGRMAGEALAGVVSAKRQEDYTWRELAGPLGLKEANLNAFVTERGWTATPPASLACHWRPISSQDTITYSELSLRDGRSEGMAATVDDTAPRDAPYSDDEIHDLKAWYAMAKSA